MLISNKIHYFRNFIVTKISFYLKSNGYILNNNNNVVSLELNQINIFNLLRHDENLTMCYRKHLKK